MSQEQFCVLQIESSAPAHLLDLSKTLSLAGVSILYLSTHQCDYILVKERRMPLVCRQLHSMLVDTDSLDPKWLQETVQEINGQVSQQ